MTPAHCLLLAILSPIAALAVVWVARALDGSKALASIKTTQEKHTVANHQQVAHRWAQDRANVQPVIGFNMFYDKREGDGPSAIYSHGHFVVACHMTDARGRRVTLFNAASYSVSTRKHQGIVRQALSGNRAVFEVDRCGPGFERTNFEGMCKRAAAHYASAQKRRNEGNRVWDLRQAQETLESAYEYAKAFKLKVRAVDLDKLAGEIKLADARAQAAYAKERKEREAREAARVAALKVEQSKRFEAWLRGEGERMIPSAYRNGDNGSVYLARFGDELVTSMGATVPWPHAVKAFEFAAKRRASGEPWKRNGEQVRVGVFNVDSIDAAGNMHAGCHYLAFEQMAACAARNGVMV